MQCICIGNASYIPADYFEVSPLYTNCFRPENQRKPKENNGGKGKQRGDGEGGKGFPPIVFLRFSQVLLGILIILFFVNAASSGYFLPIPWTPCMDEPDGSICNCSFGGRSFEQFSVNLSDEFSRTNPNTSI